MPPTHPIPDIPGIEATDPNTLQFLRSHLSQLCGVQGSRPRFPGSQPISFSLDHLQLLENMDFWVCEKSDGLRVLVFVVMNQGSGQQETWLVDRKQRFFQVPDLHFPHWENPDRPLTDTVIDGELIIDIDPKTGQHNLRYYAFDCLVINGECITKKNIIKRYARLREWVVAPFEKGLKREPSWREVLPFEIVAKKQELSYHVAEVLRTHIPQLQHGHDGLIFTCAESEYVLGTDEKILKWKPPSENSIDFKLNLRFPPSNHDPDTPDYTSKPTFLLYTWLGQSAYEFFDTMEVSDEEWDQMKDSGEQYDDRIIEVHWDTEAETWKMMRMRDDKPDANHKSILEKILISIKDGVEIDALLARADQIRSSWKQRAAQRQGQGQGPPQSQPHPAQSRPPAGRPPVYNNAPVVSSGGPGLAGLRR